MSLASLNTAAKSDTGIVVDILHPSTNQPLGIQFLVFGTDSKAYRGVSRKQQDRRLDQAKHRRGLTLRTEDIEADALEVLTACTKGWQTVDAKGVTPSIELSDGEFIEFSPEKARAIYADPGFSWLRELVDREIGNRDNFLGQ